MVKPLAGQGCIAVRQHPLVSVVDISSLVGREVVFVVGDGKVDAHRVESCRKVSHGNGANHCAAVC